MGGEDIWSEYAREEEQDGIDKARTVFLLIWISIASWWYYLTDEKGTLYVTDERVVSPHQARNFWPIPAMYFHSALV